MQIGKEHSSICYRWNIYGKKDLENNIYIGGAMLL